MSGGKRYDCTNGRAQHCYGCYEMTEAELGDYVLATDYDALKQECNRLEKFIEQAFQAHPNLDIDIEYENERT